MGRVAGDDVLAPARSRTSSRGCASRAAARRRDRGLELDLVLEIVAPGHAQAPGRGCRPRSRSRRGSGVASGRPAAPGTRPCRCSCAPVVACDTSAPPTTPRGTSCSAPGLTTFTGASLRPCPSPSSVLPPPPTATALLALMDAYVVDFYRCPRGPRASAGGPRRPARRGPSKARSSWPRPTTRPGRLRDPLLHLEHAHADRIAILNDLYISDPRPRYGRRHAAVPGSARPYPRARLRGDGVADRGRQRSRAGLLREDGRPQGRLAVLLHPLSRGAAPARCPAGRRASRGRPAAWCGRCRTASARRRGQRAPHARGSPRPARTTTCADSAGKPDVTSHTWRSWTSTTPGWAARSRPIASGSMPLGRGLEEHAPGLDQQRDARRAASSAATTSDAIGSARSKPLSSTISARRARWR